MFASQNNDCSIKVDPFELLCHENWAKLYFFCSVVRELLASVKQEKKKKNWSPCFFFFLIPLRARTPLNNSQMDLFYYLYKYIHTHVVSRNAVQRTWIRIVYKFVFFLYNVYIARAISFFPSLSSYKARKSNFNRSHLGVVRASSSVRFYTRRRQRRQQPTLNSIAIAHSRTNAFSSKSII